MLSYVRENRSITEIQSVHLLSKYKPELAEDNLLKVNTDFSRQNDEFFKQQATKSIYTN
jgi:hypothetical protein